MLKAGDDISENVKHLQFKITLRSEELKDALQLKAKERFVKLP